MTRLLVWRHGRTAWNAEHRCQGHTDIDLDEIGVEQAAAAAPSLAAERPDLIASSDLRRTTSTAKALAELTGIPLKLDERLRERYFGPWQGLLPAEILERYPDDYPRLGSAEPIMNPEIEPDSAVAHRVVAAMHDAAERVGDGTAVLVTHGGAAQVGCALLLGLPPATWHTLAVLDNCRFTDLRRHPTRGWQIHGHNRC
jgi:glucosyl-3-phosphoglycerate phosphatase